MTQLPLAPRGVAFERVHYGSRVTVPPDALCVLALRHDVVRDGIVRESAPQGRSLVAADVPAGAVVWVADGARWRAMVRT